jgi:hypothetical protein
MEAKIWGDQMKIAIALVIGLATTAFAQDAEDGAYLDAPYVRPAQSLTRSLAARERKLDARSAKSDTNALIALQTPVKSQASRGTCSIFSATATLESMLVIQNKFSTNLDLSEEWLQYLVTRNKTTDGSHSSANFQALLTYSTMEEQYLPYIGETWKTLNDSFLAQQRCGTLAGRVLTSCLIAHRNPALMTATDVQLQTPQSDLFDSEFYLARKKAKDFAPNLTGFVKGNFFVSAEEAKALLDKGIPVTMDLDFYYGAWNHRKATELGLERNLEHWEAGIVGYPEAGSLDVQVSLKERAGHSVVAVGYDDSVVVTTKVQMADGTEKTFKRKGVFYFKNSWGTASFGKDFTVDGENHPGYGAITQDYVNDYGTFYSIPQN